MTLTYFEILSFSNFAQFVKVKNPSILSAYQWPNSNLTSDNHKKGRFWLLLARSALNQKGTWRSWALIETLFGLSRAFAKAPGGILNPPYNFWPDCWTLPAAYGVVLYGRIGRAAGAEEVALLPAAVVPVLFPAVLGQKARLGQPNHFSCTVTIKQDRCCYSCTNFLLFFCLKETKKNINWFGIVYQTIVIWFQVLNDFL